MIFICISLYCKLVPVQKPRILDFKNLLVQNAASVCLTLSPVRLRHLEA